MIGHSFRALWDEPRPSRPPARVWRDWVLLGVVVAGSVVEVLLREDRLWLRLAAIVSVVIALTLLWRRTRPLVSVAVAFGTLLAFDVARIVVIDGTGLASIAAALVLPYALVRWGSGREVVGGLVIILVWLGVTHVADPTTAAEVVAGYAFFLCSAALGAAIRFHATSRLREIEQAELRQRQELARDLHDVVGHHVSGIAIQAQAGQALATTQPDRALGVLATIEDAATQALAEMRAMVGVLRDDGEPELTPRPRLADLERFTHTPGTPRVDLHRSGTLGDVPPAVEVALYRIAQEAVTNTRRHARNARLVTIEVDGDAERVHLSVRDDGDRVASNRSPSGFGLVSMRERIALLGGTLATGPGIDGGWVVEAALPRRTPVPTPPRSPQRSV
ncbi:MAG: sensor histidine kinase [Nitriliruptor sp.]|nr:MAG: sensor histidine kinase [Nitriliruptor sp.]